MEARDPSPAPQGLSCKPGLLLLVGAALAFHLAYSSAALSFLIALYLWCLFQLTRLKTSRQAFYCGLATGFLCFAPQAGFLWTIFHAAAIPLWLILAFWTALFVLLGRLARVHFGPVGGVWLMPFLWMGLEYFRSELYYLRFSWLNVGYVFATNAHNFPLRFTGMYGIGFLLMAAIAATALLVGKKRFLVGASLLALMGFATNFADHSKAPLTAGGLEINMATLVPRGPVPSPRDAGVGRGLGRGEVINHFGQSKTTPLPVRASRGEGEDGRSITVATLIAPDLINEKTNGTLQVAGVQLEFPGEQQVLLNLDKLVKEHPAAQLLVLSEYTFTGPVPQKIKDWCRKNQRYLVVGGEEPVADTYFNTAFVIDPNGEIVFRQGKCVPIQFFKDGLPANEQKLWDSPWGKIGFCICYDLSYTRVTDELIRLGAQAIIVPTMDVVDWGRHQHELHARVAPTRAAEYGVPIFRLSSSGISQFVDGTGHVLATAPMPGEEITLSAPLSLATHGRLPWDRLLAPCAVVITGCATCWFVFIAFKQRKLLQPKQP